VCHAVFSYSLEAAAEASIGGGRLSRRCRQIFTRESSYCFQRVLAIAILSVCPSITRVDESKTVQARITKFSPSAARKTLVSGSVKLPQKRGHPDRGR